MLEGDGPATRAARAQYAARECIDRLLEELRSHLSVATTESLVRAYNALAPGGVPQSEHAGEVDLVTARVEEAREELWSLVERLPEPAATRLREALPHVEEALMVRRSVTGR